MAKLPGLGARIADNAHALALGKVVLAMAPPEVVERYLQAGLRRFSAHTITDPDALRDELREVRRRGYAVDREEFDEDFCCIAAPVLDPRGRFLAAIGISMTRRAFDDEHETLAQTVVAVALAAGARARAGLPDGTVSAYDIARFQASSEIPPVLDRARRRGPSLGRAEPPCRERRMRPSTLTARATARSERRCRP